MQREKTCPLCIFAQHFFQYKLRNLLHHDGLSENGKVVSTKARIKTAVAQLLLLLLRMIEERMGVA